MSSKWDAAIIDPTERAKFDQAVVFARQMGNEAFVQEVQGLIHAAFSTDEMRTLLGTLAVVSEAFNQPEPTLEFVQKPLNWRATLRLSMIDSQTPTT